ncbi:MAG: FliA/WhiG family RNA polymerase sigma factor [Candidatus Omnitrophica bacterium]|nr:FliA/WhiG family RNA polymerase sigma factor [Candidatus Omnitrophota bacterium]MBD3269262.1 FliA/WhiG family RNA polymerase sigma factor [Candidatus Omnitrophota bacterium]
MSEQELAISREKVLEYLPLIKKVASRIFLKIPHQLLNFEDLVGYGIIGLIESFNTFDSGKGVKFSTYAFYRIRGSILDALRDLDWLPRTIRSKIHKIEEAINELTVSLERSPTDKEVADKLGMEAGEVASLLVDSSQSEVISLENNLHNYIASKTDNFMNMEYAEIADLKNILAEAIKELPEKERLGLTLYYYEELNLKEIGEVLNLSESRVCQILKSAISHLRSSLDFLRKEL